MRTIYFILVLSLISFHYDYLFSHNDFTIVEGGIIRGSRDSRELSIVFTGHEYTDGAEVILETLKNQGVKGSFFLTGDFYRGFPEISRRLQESGHYMAPHSDKHLLYTDWDNRDSTLITRNELHTDLIDNYKAMHDNGVSIEKPLYFMPPYEWYNSDISRWTKDLEVEIVNFTPGTTSNADYTTPDMANYRSSEVIHNNILEYEEKDEYGLNGFILLIHIGTNPKRVDKLYDRLDDLIVDLRSRGYEFVRIAELLSKK